MNKYNARKTVVDGIQFDSIRESKRYAELKLLEKAGEIINLRIHPKFLIEVNDEKICNYIADFSYDELMGSERGVGLYKYCVEDTKGVRTPVYKLKKKLMKAIYDIEIQEV